MLIIGGLIISLSGCSSLQSAKTEGTFLQPTQTTGVIVGSVTAPKVQHYWQVVRFNYRKLGEDTVHFVESASPTTNFLWLKNQTIKPNAHAPDTGLEKQLGRLFAINLPVGTYEVFQLSAKGKPLIAIPPIQFIVEPNQVNYIGNLQVKFCLYHPKDKVFRGYINGAIPSIKDEMARDLPLLIKKYPELQTELHKNKVNTEIINDKAWRDLKNAELINDESKCDFEHL